MHVEPNIRLMTLEVVGALAAFVFVFARSSARTPVSGAQDEHGVMQALEVAVEEEGRTRTLRLPLPMTIGRASDAALMLQDVQVSRMHARIDQVEGTLFLHDLQSRNGTLLNARPVEAPVPLTPGDEVDIGAARIMIGKVAPWK